MAVKSVQGTIVNLDDEDSIGTTGSSGKVVSVARRQSAGARRDFEEAPKCPHCAGRMHMNLPIASTNFECLWRQYNMATGGMTDPSDRFPAFTVADIDPLNEWIKVRSRSRKLGPLTYGKMESAGGGAATYAMAKTAAKADDDVDPAAAAKAAKAVKTVKKGAAAATIPVSAPTGKRTAKAVEPEPELSPAKRIRATSTTSVKTAVAPTKTGTNGKASKKEFSLDDMELDDAPAVRAPSKGQAIPRNGVKATPPSQGKGAAPAKAVKAVAPAPAKAGGRRQAALAGIK